MDVCSAAGLGAPLPGWRVIRYLPSRGTKQHAAKAANAGCFTATAVASGAEAGEAMAPALLLVSQEAGRQVSTV